MKRAPNDHAGINYWNNLYQNKHHDFIPRPWEPTEYHDKVISNFIEKIIKLKNPSNILEIGCADSTWLGYLSKKYSLDAVGIDYSKEGCDLARQRLASENVNGKIICCDMFSKCETFKTQFDLVYSLGVVEHFDNLHHVLSTLASFLKTNGILVTTIPNLFSIHGILCHLWHPDILQKHVIIKMKDIVEAYRKLEFANIEYHFAGFFSLSIVQWDNCTRWPKIGNKLSPSIKKINHKLHRFLDEKKIYTGGSILSPYIVISGKKISRF